MLLALVELSCVDPSQLHLDFTNEKNVAAFNLFLTGKINQTSTAKSPVFILVIAIILMNIDALHVGALGSNGASQCS